MHGASPSPHRAASRPATAALEGRSACACACACASAPRASERVQRCGAECKLQTAEPEGRRKHYHAMMMLQPARSALSPRPGPSRHHSPLASRSENSVAVMQSAVGGEELCKLRNLAPGMHADPLRQGATAGAPPALSSHARESDRKKGKRSSFTRQGKATKQGNAGDADLAPPGSLWFSGGGCAFRPMV
jgi:hypothetical protein